MGAGVRKYSLLSSFELLWKALPNDIIVVHSLNDGHGEVSQFRSLHSSSDRQCRRVH
ncbi:hypothetical protein NTG1052_210113 [Candidatus Nitrotoga sp. 1052]|nr:hypothetical protein NTG1052_210113 [Candidatus Nitrotoga sp. 1052]